MHGFPHNGEASTFPDASLFDAALAMPQQLAADLGIAPPTVVSQRDVPGWTRAAIPLLARRGITGLSIGAGQPPGMPDTPPIFVWRDLASGTEVVVTYESGYGAASKSARQNATVFVLPSGIAFAAGWNGDNQGPPPIADQADDFASIRTLFPNATVKASTLEDFFNEANRPEVKAALPVVTAEIGDGWIYGVPSDPLKNSMLLEAARQRRACVESGVCNVSTPGLRACDRLLMKVPEHTWGVASQIFLPDYENWTNVQFDTARQSQLHTGFLNDTSQSHADYNTTINSWIEQRTFVTGAAAVLASEHPALSRSMIAAFAALREVHPPSTINHAPVLSSDTFVCGTVRVKFDSRGAVAMLSANGVEWASEQHPLGLFQYRTYDNEDYNVFLQDFASRVDGPGCGGYHPGSVDDSNCKNFRKPNVSSASPQQRALVPSLSALYRADPSSTEGCQFVAELEMDVSAHTNAGAPERIVLGVNVTADHVYWEVVQVNKRPTRLPEASFFSFNPAPAAMQPSGWRIAVLGSADIDPVDVLGGGPGGGATNASVYGGSPHLRGIERATWTSALGHSADISSLDVPVACLGEPTPFPSPRTAPPNMTAGVHYNIHQNIWNTNYVLFYPFDPADHNIRSRFEINLK